MGLIHATCFQQNKSEAITIVVAQRWEQATRIQEVKAEPTVQSVPIPITRSRPAASPNARKSRSRVRREMPRWIQVWAINASPRRALRPFAIAFALSIPARCQ